MCVRSAGIKVLVTGGAGYIGSVVVDQLIDAGHAVVVIDNLSQGHRAAVHPEASFHQGDLANRGWLDETMRIERPAAIMHFASKSLVGESMQRPFLYLGENLRNGINLLESAVDHGVERFILSSTANLFACASSEPIAESQPINPGSPYGESKFLLERILCWLDRTEKIRFATLRYFNAAGATTSRGEDHNPETHLIPLVLRVASGQRDCVDIFGNDYSTADGTCVRDYIHVSDLAQAHLLALDHIGSTSHTWNLGNGLGFSVREVIRAAQEVTGCEIPARVVGRRPGDVPTLIACSRQIGRDLGWKPRYTDIRSIIETAWSWRNAHPHGYRSDRSESLVSRPPPSARTSRK